MRINTVINVVLASVVFIVHMGTSEVTPVLKAQTQDTTRLMLYSTSL